MKDRLCDPARLRPDLFLRSAIVVGAVCGTVAPLSPRRTGSGRRRRTTCSATSPHPAPAAARGGTHHAAIPTAIPSRPTSSAGPPRPRPTAAIRHRPHRHRDRAWGHRQAPGRGAGHRNHDHRELAGHRDHREFGDHRIATAASERKIFLREISRGPSSRPRRCRSRSSARSRGAELEATQVAESRRWGRPRP